MEMKSSLQPLPEDIKKSLSPNDIHIDQTRRDPNYNERHAQCVERDAALDGWHNLQSGDLIPGFNITDQDHVLDVGCGGAGHSRFCLLRGATVTFTDINATVVANA